jgi:hypothetical protein
MAQWLHRGRRDRHGGNGRLVDSDDRLALSSRLANPIKSEGFMTLWRLYLYETLLEGLAEDFQDVAAKLRELIEKHDTMVRQRHLAWHGHLAPTDQPDVRNGVVRSAKRARHDAGGAVAGKAGHAVDARGVERFGQGHIRQDGGEPTRQHRLACAGGAQGQKARIRSAFASASGGS